MPHVFLDIFGRNTGLEKIVENGLLIFRCLAAVAGFHGQDSFQIFHGLVVGLGLGLFGPFPCFAPVDKLFPGFIKTFKSVKRREEHVPGGKFNRRSGQEEDIEKVFKCQLRIGKTTFHGVPERVFFVDDKVFCGKRFL